MTWETVVRGVTAISYSQYGLYKQFHRREEDVYSNIDYLYRKRYGKEPTFRNVPNQYVAKGPMTTRVTSASHLPVQGKPS